MYLKFKVLTHTITIFVFTFASNALRNFCSDCQSIYFECHWMPPLERGTSFVLKTRTYIVFLTFTLLKSCQLNNRRLLYLWKMGTRVILSPSRWAMDTFTRVNPFSIIISQIRTLFYTTK